MSGPKVEITQHDRLEEWRRGIDAMERQIEEQRPIQAAEREERRRRAHYGLREELFFLGRRMPSKEGQPERVRVDCIAGLPEAGMQVWAEGEAESVSEAADIALHEARFRYAQALVGARVCKDMEAARDRAVKTDLRMADLVGV